MKNREFKLELIDAIKKRGPYSVSRNGIQYYTRCPYCGDSHHLHHAHFSIKIDVNSDEPLLCRCLMCPVSGIVNKEILSDLDIHLTKESHAQFISYTRASMRTARLVNKEAEKFSVPVYQDTQMNRWKLDYVNDRLGTSISLREAKDYEIILNLKEFMIHNEIYHKDRLVLLQDYRTLQLMNQYYVGFLSTNRNTITFRDVTGKQKYRYYKLRINEQNVNMDSFYRIPYSFDLLYTDTMHIHIAEGIFDILSIKKNLHPNDSQNHVFFANCGFGSISVIRYLIHHYATTGLHLHIYCDKDKPDWLQKQDLFTKNHYEEWVDRIDLHRNFYPNEKDYGVPIDRIQDRWKTIY